MGFISEFSALPKVRREFSAIESASSRLYDKLRHLDIEPMAISDYTKRYLSDYIKNLFPALSKYAYMLTWCLSSSRKCLSSMVVVDYGGGSGIFSLLARELGIGHVIYDDIYDLACRDAQTIARKLDLCAEEYVCGDMGAVLGYFSKKGFDCDCITSFDVIEHVYDPKSYLNSIGSLPGADTSLVMCSGANPLNPLIRRRLVNEQNRIDRFGDQPRYGHKPRDSTEPYSEIRKRIIRGRIQDIGEGELEFLSNATRGFVEHDITEAVDRYLDGNSLTSPEEYPTNTCDPLTGNWCEHLMDPFKLAAMIEERGFDAKVLPGYYPRVPYISPGSRFQRQTTSILNQMILQFEPISLHLAPFYTIYGLRTGNPIE
jgi:2-polyprenyl-3-methyl-5-hydroxy-6-metoxy-1,4-benzoquinol methylase